MSNVNNDDAKPQLNPTLADAKLEVNTTLVDGNVEVNPTLADAKLEVNPTLADGKLEVNPTLADGKLEVNTTLVDGNVEVNHNISTTKPLVNQVKWLKKIMSVSASQDMQNDISGTGIAGNCNNITQFLSKMLSQHYRNLKRLEDLQIYCQKQDDELYKQVTELTSQALTIEALNNTLAHAQSINEALKEQRTALPKNLGTLPALEPQRFGIFALLNPNK
jgi:hypothetical protein